MDVSVLVLMISQLLQVSEAVVPVRDKLWLECVQKKDIVFEYSLFHTWNLTLLECMGLCLMTDKCVFANAIANTGECKGYTNLTSSTPRIGARLWGAWCPYIYLSPAGLCVTFSTVEEQWNDALSTCESAGNRLLILDSQDKFDTFNTFMSSYADKRLYYWVGATDVGDKDWKWLNGEPVNTSLFYFAEADYDYVYDFVGVWNIGTGYALDASDGSLTFPAICEYDVCATT